MKAAKNFLFSFSISKVNKVENISFYDTVRVGEFFIKSASLKTQLPISRYESLKLASLRWLRAFLMKIYGYNLRSKKLVWKIYILLKAKVCRGNVRFFGDNWG